MGFLRPLEAGAKRIEIANGAQYSRSMRCSGGQNAARCHQSLAAHPNLGFSRTMNHLKSIVSFAALSLVCAGSMAQTYLAAGIGQGHINVECTAGATSCKTNDTMGKLTAGYTFGHGLSGEVGYLGFGKASASNSVGTAELKASAVTLGASYAIPLRGSWGLSVRLGLASVKTVSTATALGRASSSQSESHAELYTGLGASYMFTPNWFGDVGADFSRGEFQGNKGSVSALAAGVRLAF